MERAMVSTEHRLLSLRRRAGPDLLHLRRRRLLKWHLRPVHGPPGTSTLETLGRTSRHSIGASLCTIPRRSQWGATALCILVAVQIRCEHPYASKPLSTSSTIDVSRFRGFPYAIHEPIPYT
jgi:hypothetical protein